MQLNGKKKIDHIICLLLEQCRALVDWVAVTKFKLIPWALSDIPLNLIPLKIPQHMVYCSVSLYVQVHACTYEL